MYPNIILTNRLQPCSMVNESICALCVHNRPKTFWCVRCAFFPCCSLLFHAAGLGSAPYSLHGLSRGSQRRMKWMWRGEYIKGNRHEYEQIKLQLQSENILLLLLSPPPPPPLPLSMMMVVMVMIACP